MTLPATAKWILLALLGIAVAVAIAIAAGNLASRQIGLASEPISAGDALAPATSTKGGSHVSHNKSEREAEPPTTTTTAPETEKTAPETTTPPTETQPSPGRDDSHGGGDSGGHGADD